MRSYSILQLHISSIASLAAIAMFAACGGKVAGSKKFVGPTNGATSPPPVASGGTAPSDFKITLDISTQEVLVGAGALGSACTVLTATLKDQLSDAPLPNIVVQFAHSASGKEALGSFDVSELKSNDLGVSKSNFCANQESEGTTTFIAKVGNTQTNSGVFTVKRNPTWNFVSLDAQSAGAAPSASGSLASSETNTATFGVTLRDGDEPCREMRFAVKRDGKAFPGVSASFRTQDNIPPGSKLATIDEAGIFIANPVSGRSYSYYEGTSDAQGVFKVPVCGGSQSGSFRVTGNVVALGSRPALESIGPTVKVTGSLVSHGNMSIKYEPVNPYVLKSSLPSNSKSKLDFLADLGAKFDVAATLSRKWVMGVLAEFGKIIVDKDGEINENGEAKFTLEMQNLASNWPTRVYPTFSTMCDPNHPSFTAFNPAGVDYSVLARNWRSTVAYHTTGQEYFYDANANGIYDGPSDGFWDKNQNGVYDVGVDQITSDIDGDGQIDTDGGTGLGGVVFTGEYFRDLPSAFVDANENGIKDSQEIYFGNSFVDANGKWDAQTTVWKNFRVPVSFGLSIFSMTRNMAGPASLSGISGGLAGYLANPIYGYSATGATSSIFGRSSFTASSIISGFSTKAALMFLHDVCGSPLPGGTEITSNVETIGTPVGSRVPIVRFFVQPPDIYIEGERQLLRDAGGGGTAKVGGYLLDHPTEPHGYPAQFFIDMPQCENECTGDILSSGIYCSAQAHDVRVKLGEYTLSHRLTYSAVQTCTCVGGALFSAGACTCPDGLESNGATCVVPP